MAATSFWMDWCTETIRLAATGAPFEAHAAELARRLQAVHAEAASAAGHAWRAPPDVPQEEAAITPIAPGPSDATLQAMANAIIAADSTAIEHWSRVAAREAYRIAAIGQSAETARLRESERRLADALIGMVETFRRCCICADSGEVADADDAVSEARAILAARAQPAEEQT